MVALRQVRPYRGLRRVRPYRGLRPRLACGLWIVRFQQLKKRFLKTLILAVFDPELPIILKTDVSDYAIGACII